MIERRVIDLVQLSFDFDYDNINKFEPTLEYLHKTYGDKVRVRRSAHRGWHIWVTEIEMSADEELKLRDRLGDCEGRREGDYARMGVGLKTSRLFDVKGRITDGKKVVRSAGKWMTYEEWKQTK